MNRLRTSKNESIRTEYRAALMFSVHETMHCEQHVTSVGASCWADILLPVYESSWLATTTVICLCDGLSSSQSRATLSSPSHASRSLPSLITSLRPWPARLCFACPCVLRCWLPLQHYRTRKLKAAGSHMMPPPLHVWNGLASPADAACRMYCEICEVVRYAAAPV